MSKLEELRTLVNQRLSAVAEEVFGLFEKTMVEYEEIFSRSQQENVRLRKLVEATFNPVVRLHRTDILQLQGSPSPDQEEPEPTPIKDEQQELWIDQQGEQGCGVEGAVVATFCLTDVFSKTETDEVNVQLSQLHQIQTENTAIESLSSSSTEQTDADADEEDYGAPEPARTSDPGRKDEASDSSQLEAEYNEATCEETRVPQSGLNTPSHNELCINKMQHTTTQKSIRCLRSGSTFQYDKSLQRHKGKKKLHCLVCSRGFTRNDHLQMHMRIHTREKPFKCPICGSRFNQSGHLRQHMKIHKGQKPFNCTVCGKQFSGQADRRGHIRIHMGEQTYTCGICGKK